MLSGILIQYIYWLDILIWNINVIIIINHIKYYGLVYNIINYHITLLTYILCILGLYKSMILVYIIVYKDLQYSLVIISYYYISKL